MGKKRKREGKKEEGTDTSERESSMSFGGSATLPFLLGLELKGAQERHELK